MRVIGQLFTRLPQRSLIHLVHPRPRQHNHNRGPSGFPFRSRAGRSPPVRSGASRAASAACPSSPEWYSGRRQLGDGHQSRRDHATFWCPCPLRPLQRR
jgi:hypothetical protein